MKPANPLVTVLPIFVVTRVAIFLAATAATDSLAYHQYGVAARVASVAALFRSYDVEYPQLAVAFAAGVGWFADALPTGAERLIAARPNRPPDVGTARFQFALGLVLFTVDLGLLLLLARLTWHDEPRERTWRLGLYVAATAALGPILYDRLDLIVGAVALLAVWAFIRGWPAVAYLLLTLGAGFKLVPVLLVPVFVLACAARSPRFWPAVVRQAILAGVILATWPVLAYIFGGGDRAFVYLKYHAARGPELGSIYGGPLLLAGGTEVGYEYGGYAIRGPSADTAAKLAAIIGPVAVGLASLLAARALRRTRGELSVVVASCVLVLLVFIDTNKVGSPQYLLWVVPLVPLLPLRTVADRRWAVGLVVACAVTTLMYPYLWVNVHGAPVLDQAGTWAGPNALGFTLLFIRWSILVALTVGIARRGNRCTPPGESRLQPGEVSAHGQAGPGAGT